MAYLSDRKRGDHPNLPSLKELIRSFDPAYCYIIIIFDGLQGPKEVRKVQEIISMLTSLCGEELKYEVHSDETEEKIFLLVKIDDDKTDAIVRKLPEIAMPRYITFYVYRSRANLTLVTRGNES